MNFYNFHVNDFRGATWHLDRLHRSIYRDLIDEYYLTEKPLTSDLVMLAHKMGCRSEEEKTALAQVLNEFFVKKNGKWHHKRIDREIKNYQHRHQSNATLATDATPNSELCNADATDVATQCNANTQRSQRYRERQKIVKRLVDEFGLSIDKSSSLEDLQALLAECETRNATPNSELCNADATDVATQCNAKKSAITNNQEPILNTHTPPAREAKWERFAMHTDWTFDESNVLGLMRMAGIGGKLFDPVLQDSRFRFVNYHSAKPDGKHTQAEWESKLVSWLLADWRKHEAEPVKLVKPAQREETAPAVSKTKQSVMALMSAKEAVLSGQVETILPKPVFVVLVDGLLDLLGQGLSYPPASDAWAFTLSVWGGELAKRGLDGDDAGRLQTAFAELKKWALSDAGGRKFPEISDLVKCLPARIVPLIRKVETAEEFEQRKARGRRGMEKIKASLKGA